jgi:predicted enzyme related to lactoylglutathione lyase
MLFNASAFLRAVISLLKRFCESAVIYNKQIDMKHLVNWVEIPVLDLRRAVTFYMAALDITFQEMSIGNMKYALFPSEDHRNTGALVEGTNYKPSAEGITIYLDGGNDLNTILGKVPAAGGQVVLEKTFLSPEAGYIGFFLDSEGNKIGLQNM